MKTAIILAGGTGTRVGSKIPKQFINVLGKPIIVYVIETFQNMQEIDAIEIVCLENYIGYMEQLVEEYDLKKVKYIIPGGATYHDSLIKGIDNLRNDLSDDDMIILHIGASPFTSEEIIKDCICVCEKHGNGNSGTPLYIVLGTNNGECS